MAAPLLLAHTLRRGAVLIGMHAAGAPARRPPLARSLLTWMGNSMSAKNETPAAPLVPAAGTDVATFAAGCFWGVEKSFKRKFGGDEGLLQCQVGYCGGTKEHATYREVCSGSTGHAEAIQIVYDPAKLSFEQLIDFFYRMHDPTTLNRQGGDTGTQYRSAVFFHSDKQKEIAEAQTKLAQTHYGATKIQTTIEAPGKFWPAEEYHQEYLDKNPHGYECPTHFERSWERIEQLFKSGK
ncbi:Peptide methionine sulfoxide reductase [Polyrhizophydium stewartii]|uniref:peptide-methionine (S)-S-oxide reductase n=1 Tax=Polyrhizophydium stewartii TaxID=2732419 RepID=A0ABR4NGD8_9FUNG